MPISSKKHPVIRAIAIIAVIGGLVTMGNSLVLLHSALQQHNWPAAPLHRDALHGLSYRVGERDFAVPPAILPQGETSTLVFYNPELPDEMRFERPNFWWPLYLSMAGLIVFYAGLHLLREKDRNIESLSFE